MQRDNNYGAKKERLSKAKKRLAQAKTGDERQQIEREVLATLNPGLEQIGAAVDDLKSKADRLRATQFERAKQKGVVPHLSKKEQDKQAYLAKLQQIWNDAAGEDDVSADSKRTLAVLNHYAKPNRWQRIISGNWNRTHLKEVHGLINFPKKDEHKYKTGEELLLELRANIKGSIKGDGKLDWTMQFLSGVVKGESRESTEEVDFRYEGRRGYNPYSS